MTKNAFLQTMDCCCNRTKLASACFARPASIDCLYNYGTIILQDQFEFLQFIVGLAVLVHAVTISVIGC